MPSHVTVLIAARNAAPTVERAVRSALAQDSSPVVLLDDGSDDDTAAIARRAGGRRLQVVRLPGHGPRGLMRQAGLEAVTTPFALWMDAADEALPGRAKRLVTRAAAEGADLVYDAAVLHDGDTGGVLRHLAIPYCLMEDPTGVREFERNLLGSLGRPLVRMTWAQRIGYDVGCRTAEDYDFLLRSCMEGARIAWEPAVGYRHYAQPAAAAATDDRREDMRRLLAKHPYPIIRARFQAAGHGAAVTAWALVSVAIHREDWDSARRLLDEIAQVTTHADAVLEPEGPCQRSEAWRLAFHRGTVALLAGDPDTGYRHLAEAHKRDASPETSNNLGVAMAGLGAGIVARRLFAQALKAYPGYVDAARNLAAPVPSAITPHPLRAAPSRIEYPVLVRQTA